MQTGPAVCWAARPARLDLGTCAKGPPAAGCAALVPLTGVVIEDPYRMVARTPRVGCGIVDRAMMRAKCRLACLHVDGRARWTGLGHRLNGTGTCRLKEDFESGQWSYLLAINARG